MLTEFLYVLLYNLEIKIYTVLGPIRETGRRRG